jgi:membrane protein DedA with SNARE-associated domain
MTLESLVDAYGYVAVLVGTFLEGETILVLGGFAAHRGYMALPWVILAAFIGSLCGDQLFFFLGRWHSQAILSKRPTWKVRVDKAQKLLERFRTPLILAFRFLYGLRTVAPFVIGMSSVSTAKFIFLNAAGALVWAAAVGTGGYLFGSALEILIGNIKHYEIQILGAIAAIGVLIWVIYFYRRRKRKLSAAWFGSH